MSKTLKANQECTLCSASLKRPICDDRGSFCCSGCQAVYHILSAKGDAEDFRQSPVFQQALKYGLISNPALLQQPEVKEEERRRIHLEIGQMWCPSCAELVRLALLNKKGVISVVVDYATDLAAVEFSPRYIAQEEIFARIRSLGYTAGRPFEEEQKGAMRPLLLRFGIAAFLALNLMMFSYPIYSSYFIRDTVGYAALFARLSLFAALPVISYCAFPIWRRCVHALKAGIFGMEVLVLTGVGAAFTLSLYELMQGGAHVYFDSMSVIIALVLLGKIVEGRAKFSAKDTLFRLARASPKRGRKRLEGGSLVFVPVKEVKKGELLVAYSGEKIVLDGEVVSGSGAVDESVMTGEALPVFKEEAGKVLAGTILQNGSLTYRVTAEAGETALQRIMETITLDIGHKTAYVRVADRIAARFVPAVFLIALLTLFLSGSFREGALAAISVLLISCPCAIGVAAPLAEARLMQALAAQGALVRNRGVLPLLGRETVALFDKTGTVTEGRFRVVSGLEPLTVEERRLLKGVAEQSLHPLSVAIASSINEPSLEVGGIEEHFGRGVIGQRGARRLLLGSRKFLQSFGAKVPEEEEGGAFSRVFFAIGPELKTVLLLSDTLRPGAEKTASSLNSYLLSGDSNEAVRSVAEACRFKRWRGECHPLEKCEVVRQLKQEGEGILFVGDGINDAAALTEAHVAVSVVSASDISIQVSDILLTTSRLDTVLKVRSLGRAGQRIVRQNLFWAFFYNGIGIGLAAFGLLTPLFAAAAMVLSSLMVLANTARLSREGSRRFCTGRSPRNF